MTKLKIDIEIVFTFMYMTNCSSTSLLFQKAINYEIYLLITYYIQLKVQSQTIDRNPSLFMLDYKK